MHLLNVQRDCNDGRRNETSGFIHIKMMVVSTGYTNCIYQTREADGYYETGVNYEQTTIWPSLTDQQQMTKSLLG